MYTWTDDENNEIWRKDIFETIEDCILDAKENYCKEEGEDIAIGIICPYTPDIFIEGILEDIEIRAYERCGEVAESWDISTRKGHENEMDELEKKVTEAVNDYLEKIKGKPSFYTIEDIHTFILT